MKKYLFAFIVLAACSGATQTAVLSPAEFQEKLNSTPDAILIDVRTPEEIAVDRIENSRNIVYDESFETKLADVEQKPVFVYCAAGKRSAKAAQILRDKGYKNVFELEGGLNAWKEAGLPVISTQK
jgi:rhodanese-related sulfurtransferase